MTIDGISNPGHVAREIMRLHKEHVESGSHKEVMTSEIKEISVE